MSSFPPAPFAGGGTRTDLALALVVMLILTLLFESWLGQRNYE